MSRRQKDLDVTIGRGYVGRWQDGAIGWCLPAHIDNRPDAEPPSDIFDANAGPEDRAVLCEITVRVLKDSLGREIGRRPRRPDGGAK